MKKIIIIVISLIALVGCTLLIIDHIRLTDSVSALMNELSAVNIEKLSKTDQISQLTKDNTDLKTSNSGLLNQVDKYKSDLSDKTTENNRISLELASYKEKFECKNTSTYKFNFTSNSTISESLKILVGDTSGSVESASWDLVWDNSKVAIHDLRTKDYKIAFVVYFDESDLDYKNSIFWIDRGCFLPID